MNWIDLSAYNIEVGRTFINSKRFIAFCFNEQNEVSKKIISKCILLNDIYCLPYNSNSGNFLLSFPKAKKTINIDPNSLPKITKSINFKADNIIVQKSNSKNPNHYFMHENDKTFNHAEIASNNLEAIKILKKFDKIDLDIISKRIKKEEKDILAKYRGWGGVANYLSKVPPINSVNKTIHKKIHETVSTHELFELMKQSDTSFYTPPVIIKNLWEMLENNGFKKGNILEPAVGIGNFFGFAPQSIVDKSSFYGIDADPYASRIASILYPEAKIKNIELQKTNIQNNFYDLVISNVPFSSTKVYTLDIEKDLSLHDFYIYKMLDFVKPDGIGIAITSAYTLNKKDSFIRREINKKAILIDAVRLPTDIFKNYAGTSTNTDILILKKRLNPLQSDINRPDWIDISGLETKPQNYTIPINNYFKKNPQKIAGDIYFESDRSGYFAVKIKDNDTLASVIQNIKIPLKSTHLKKQLQQEAELTLPNKFQNLCAGSFVEEKDKFYQVNESRTKTIPYELPEIQKPILSGFIQIRDAVEDLLSYEFSNPNITTEDTNYIKKQTILNDLYDEFVVNFGPLNSAKNYKVFSADPKSGKILGLENYDSQTNTAKKSDIFNKIVVKNNNKETKTNNLEEASWMCLGKYGFLDFNKINEFYNKNISNNEIKEWLVENEKIFYNPLSNKWEIREVYLSGNVRQKYKDINNLKGRLFEKNKNALLSVMPENILPGDIEVRLGSAWIPDQYIKVFLTKMIFISKTETNVSRSKLDGTWALEAKPNHCNYNNIYYEYGTTRMNAIQIVKNLLNQNEIAIYDTIEVNVDGQYKQKKIINREETLQAQHKAERINSEFRNFLFNANDDRTNKLVSLYNDTINCYVKPSYNGTNLELPGLSRFFTPRSHQKDAVMKGLIEERGLFAHEVGTGKTAIMIMLAMELKRLGKAYKPLIAVTNSSIKQINNDFYKLYPNANVLLIQTEDLNKKNRNKFLGKIINNEWDAVIITHPVLKKIKNDPEFESRFYQNILEKYEDEITTLSLDSNAAYKVKDIAKKTKILRNRIDKLNVKTNKNKDEVFFSELGVDALIVDEAHNFKNLELLGGPISIGKGSDQAWDLYLKTKFIYDKRGTISGVFFATGTPVSNNVIEIYQMQRYLQPDTLQNFGCQNIENPTTWASLFLNPKQYWEPTVAGDSWQQKIRYGLMNIPELMNSLHQVMDVITIEDIKLKIPETQTVNETVALNEDQKVMMSVLSERCKRLKRGKSPENDNVLNVISEGRKLSLDARLLCDSLPENSKNKIKTLTKNVLQEYNNSKDIKGVQLVFCQLGVKKTKMSNFVIYSEIKKCLKKAGISASEIAFANDGGTNASKKEQLLQDVRDGKKRILIGTSAKMGEAINVQDRAVAVHFMDAPWRPSDVVQSIARVARFGNMNEHVRSYIYTTEDSFDVFIWNLLKQKNRDFGMILKGSKDIRSFDFDLDPTYAETVAITSNNTFLRDKLQTEQEITRLKAIKRGFENERHNRLIDLECTKKRLSDVEATIKRYSNVPQIDMTKYKDDEKPVWTIDMSMYEKDGEIKKCSGSNLSKMINFILNNNSKIKEVEGITYSGIPLTYYRINSGIQNAQFSKWEVKTNDDKLVSVRYQTAIIRLLEDRENFVSSYVAEKEKLHKKIESLNSLISNKFGYEDELNNLKAKVKTIELQIQNMENEKETEKPIDFSDDELYDYAMLFNRLKFEKENNLDFQKDDDNEERKKIVNF
jgi:N12 class adenine-specific DNA methylase